ncbi:rab11 family-interacting protein 5 [Tiliqua scincoides]|uniref:rab11 family-interacting protein 5 n=1 Tax=Tiliqua scincoides TaxID=71010 RepID=UPI0034627690
MSLLRVSELRPQEEEAATAAAMLPSGARWLPSHVQVTVQRARALRPKGGPDDAFVVLQLGRQKLRTSVATQRGGGPRWGEECALELPPSSAPDELEGEALLLRLTVWQRALVGPDRFLGRAAVPLAALLEGGRSHQDQWYKLHSKPGKKEKERGEIQLSIQFTRHSLTASMFDLSIKDKPRSPFSRLKDKVKGRRKYDLESASAIVPSSSGGLDDGDFDPAGKKAKALGGGFFKSRLRKSSLTQSSTSLGSDSTVSSAGSLVGLGAAEVMAPSPSRHSSLSTDRSVGDFLSSPKLTHKRAFSDEASQIRALPESKSIQSLRPQNEPTSKSSICINGSHVYCEEPSLKPASPSLVAPPAPAQSIPSKPAESLVSAGPHAPEPDLPPWSGSSLQKGPPKDPPRFIPSPPILAAQEEDKLSVKTIALNKHRGRVRQQEGLHADSRPVRMAAPLVFSSEVVRVRPRVEEEERAKAGVLHPGSDGRRLVGESLGGSPKDVVMAGGDEQGQSGRRGSQDAKESLPKPSSPPEWLAAPEVDKDACFTADRGPAAFVRVGELQVEAAAYSASHCEVAAAAAAFKPPLDWDDNFDAFATSRLRPEAWRGPPQPPAATLDVVAPAGGWDGAGPCESKGEPQDNTSHQEREEPCPARGGLPNSAPERGLTGCLGEQLERWPEDTALPWGAVLSPGAWEEASRTGGSAGAEGPGRGQPHREQLAREGDMAAAGTWQGQWPVLSAGATGDTLSDPKLALGQAVADTTSRPAFLEGGEEESTPRASAWEEPTLVLPLGGAAAEAEAGSSSWAELHSRDLGRPEQTAGLMSAGSRHQAPSEEVVDETPLEPGCSTEGGEEHAGKGEGRTAEPPPPKPPRRFTPLSLQEEASRAVWGTQGARWQEGAAEREPQEDPAGETCQQGPPLGQVSASSVPAVIIGAGGEGTGHVTESFGESAEADAPVPAQELTSQAVSSEGALLVANRGPGEAGQSATCPPKPPVGGLGQVGAQEQASSRERGGPNSPPWGALRPAELPGQALVQTAQELPRPGQTGARPSQALQESAASAPVMFWTALEEEQLWLPQDCPGWERPEGPGLGKCSPVSIQEQGDGLGLDSSQVEPAGSSAGQAPPPGLPHAQLSARGTLRERTGGGWTGESELSSSWSEDGVMDFKPAGFWQSARRGQSSTRDTVMMPGNPFASWPGPPAKNNPFVEERPGVLPASACRALLNSRVLDLEALLPGPFPASHSESQPAAPFLHGPQPLAASTPSLGAAPRPGGFEYPSPIVQVACSGGSAWPSLSGMASAPPVLPVETQPAEEGLLRQTASSPHLVRPINTPMPETTGEEEAAKQQQRSPTSGRSPALSGQQRPKPSSIDSTVPVLQLANTEPKRDPAGLDPSAKYYHLTHEELIQLVLKREAELGKKQEHVQELENYIDRLLVRIMEQSPTLLQIPLGGEPKIAK